MADRTHGGNHAPGARLSPGFCEGCDHERNIDRLTMQLAEAMACIERVRAIVDPPCTCPGACSGPPRKVRAEDIRAALDGEAE